MDTNISAEILRIVNSVGIVAVFSGIWYIAKKVQKLDDISNTVDKLKHNLTIVSNFLIKKRDFDPSELTTYSPFALTEGGKQFIEKIGFDKILEEHKEDFFDYIDDKAPKIKYEVENASFEAILALADEDFMQFFKIYLYNNPTRTMENAASTLGIYLRDKYLDEHKEITQ